MTANKERLKWYLEAERKILMQQSVETAEGEKLTLANLSTVKSEINRLQCVIAREGRGGRRSMIKRNYLE